MAMESDPIVKSQACSVLNRVVRFNPESIQAASSALKQSERDALSELIEVDVQPPELHATNPPSTPPASHSRRTSAISNVSLESRHSAVKDFVKAQRDALRSLTTTPTPGETGTVVDKVSTPIVSYVSGVYVDDSHSPVPLAGTPHSADGSPRRKSLLLSRDASYNQALTTVEEAEKNSVPTSGETKRRRSSSHLPQPSRLSGRRLEDTVAEEATRPSQALKVESLTNVEMEPTPAESTELHIQGVQIIPSQIQEPEISEPEPGSPVVNELVVSSEGNQEDVATSPLKIEGQGILDEPASIVIEEKVRVEDSQVEDADIVEKVVQTCLQEIGLVLQEPSPVSPVLLSIDEVIAMERELGLAVDSALSDPESNIRIETKSSERGENIHLEIEGKGLPGNSGTPYNDEVLPKTKDTHAVSVNTKEGQMSTILGQLETAIDRSNLKLSLEQLQVALKTAKGIDTPTSSRILQTTLTCQKNLVYPIN
jgi:hypothetical protein